MIYNFTSLEEREQIRLDIVAKNKLKQSNDPTLEVEISNSYTNLEYTKGTVTIVNIAEDKRKNPPIKNMTQIEFLQFLAKEKVINII